jgi:hypothetical protein
MSRDECEGGVCDWSTHRLCDKHDRAQRAAWEQQQPSAAVLSNEESGGLEGPDTDQHGRVRKLDAYNARQA